MPGATPVTSSNPMQDVNRAYERMLKSGVRYRFSIDVARLR